MSCCLTPESGHVSVGGILALALFDSGASHCYMSRRFVKKHTVPTAPLSASWNINTRSGVLIASLGCPAVLVIISGRQLYADFMVIDMPSFEAVFGISWLGTFFATIDCRQRSIIFRIPGHPELPSHREIVPTDQLSTGLHLEIPSWHRLQVSQSCHM